MTVKWHGDQFSRKLDRKIDRRLRAVSRHYRDSVRKNIGRARPVPSRPGQFPRRDTGELYRSIRLRKDGKGYSVATEAPHAEHVERIRPFLLRTLREQWRRLQEIFLGR